MTVTGLELGSFSSGHVTVPLDRESKKNAHPREKQSEVFGSEFSLTLPFSKTLVGNIPGLVLNPHQGMTTDALLEKKLSDDRTCFGLFVVVRPWLV